MDTSKKKRLRRRITNFTFFGILLIILLSTNAKSLLLRGILSTGLFSAKIEQSTPGSAGTMPLTFKNTDGSIAGTEKFVGKVVFINFWASWCPPCRAEMPSLDKMYKKLKEDPKIQFVFISMDDDPVLAQKYLTDNQFEIPLQMAVGFIPTDYYTGTLPTTVVLNKTGTIVMQHSGMANYNSEKFISQLNKLKEQ